MPTYHKGNTHHNSPDTNIGAMWEEVMNYTPTKPKPPSEGEQAFLSWIDTNQKKYYGEGGIYQPLQQGEASGSPPVKRPGLQGGGVLSRGDSPAPPGSGAGGGLPGVSLGGPPPVLTQPPPSLPKPYG